VVVEHLARYVVRAKQRVVVPVAARARARRVRRVSPGRSGRLSVDVSHPDGLLKPHDPIRADEIAQVLDPPRRRRRHAVVHVHAFARAQTVQVVVQAARSFRVEEHHALLIGGRGDHAVAEHAPGAVQGDVKVRRHRGARAAAAGRRRG
jgi:hypothetical protein